MKIYNLLLCSIFVSCTSSNSDFPELNGFWRPQNIDWEEGSFKIIFIQDNTFFQLSSTQSKDEYDSIYFMVEPGVNLSGGTIGPGKLNRLVSYQDLHKDIKLLSNHFPSDMRYDTITVKMSDTLKIIFQGEKFIRTEMLKKKSIDEIKAFVKNFSN